MQWKRSVSGQFGSNWMSQSLLHAAHHKQCINNKIIKKNKKQIKKGEITTKPSLRYLDLDDSKLIDSPREVVAGISLPANWPSRGKTWWEVSGHEPRALITPNHRVFEV